MTNDYTPSLNEVRADYVAIHTRNFDSYATGRSLTSEQEFYASRFDRWLASHDADVAGRIGAILREHQPTSGMRVASGVTCRCGYWTGEERPGVTRPVGYSGLMWHQAQMIATLPAIGSGTVNGLDVRDWQQIAASKDEAVEAAMGALNRVRELHQPVDIEPSDTICGECSFRLPNGHYFGKIVDWPCATIQALDATPPVTATGEGDDRG